MSPLIDCVFQLLIFFMLSSTFLTPMVQLTLPNANTQDPRQPDEILVTVDENGTYYVNTQVVPLEQLQNHLRPLLERSQQKVVTFRGDEKIRYELFIKALDAARAAGAAHINIAHRGASQ